MSARGLHWNGLPVPYIAPWSGERTVPGEIVRRRGIGGEGIGYADEFSQTDRRDGVLWVRNSIAPGVGQPQLAGVHALRQRQAMNHMLCQVCGEPTFGRTDERHLYLVRSQDGRPIREGERTTTPPVHEACAVTAVRHCPHLRNGYTAALVGYSPTWGSPALSTTRRLFSRCRANSSNWSPSMTRASDGRSRPEWRCCCWNVRPVDPKDLVTAGAAV